MLSHINAENLPTMVDVGDKAVTRREAEAMSCVSLPASVLAALNPAGELISPKGPVFQTAIIAGTMAAKRTHELIPFCHPLPLEQIAFEMQLKTEAPAHVQISCRVRTPPGPPTHRPSMRSRKPMRSKSLKRFAMQVCEKLLLPAASLLCVRGCPNYCR